RGRDRVRRGGTVGRARHLMRPRKKAHAARRWTLCDQAPAPADHTLLSVQLRAGNRAVLGALVGGNPSGSAFAQRPLTSARMPRLGGPAVWLRVTGSPAALELGRAFLLEHLHEILVPAFGIAAIGVSGHQRQQAMHGLPRSVGRSVSSYDPEAALTTVRATPGMDDRERS